MRVGLRKWIVEKIKCYFVSTINVFTVNVLVTCIEEFRRLIFVMLVYYFSSSYERKFKTIFTVAKDKEQLL